jgi:hypothetical protein
MMTLNSLFKKSDGNFPRQSTTIRAKRISDHYVAGGGGSTEVNQPMDPEKQAVLFGIHRLVCIRELHDDLPNQSKAGSS